MDLMKKWGSDVYNWTRKCYGERQHKKHGQYNIHCSECGKDFDIGDFRFGLYSQWLCPECYPKFLKNMDTVLKNMRKELEDAKKHYNKNKGRYALQEL